MLVSGDWQGAMPRINGLPEAAGVEPATVSSTVEAWTALKRERGIVLWLERRRLGDFFRWNRDNTPGGPPCAGGGVGEPGRGLAPGSAGSLFPDSRSEIETNDNSASSSGNCGSR